MSDSSSLLSWGDLATDPVSFNSHHHHDLAGSYPLTYEPQELS